MSQDLRCKDIRWNIHRDAYGRVEWEAVTVAVLMDIRDELKLMNERLSVLRCPDFIAIPRILREIRRNTTKPKRRKK